jgi:cytochrome c-type biogenesis protein CcmH
MTIWIILTLMVAIAAAGLAVPLVRRYETRAAERSATVAVLRDQLVDIDNQERMGTVAPAEADALRAEIKRRLLAESRERDAERRPLAPRSLSLLSYGLAGVIALAATGLYAMMGRPDLGSRPAAAAGSQTAQTGPAAQQRGAEVAAMLRQLEERLQQSPEDPEGWRMLGWSHFQAGRFQDSARAYAEAVKLAPTGPGFQSAYGEALVQAAGGTVTPAAKEAFDRALALDGADARARFFLAVHKGQRGDRRGAVEDWIKLLNESPADAPWAGELRRIIEQTARDAGIDVSTRLTTAAGAGTATIAPPVAPSREPRAPTAAEVAAAQAMDPSDRQAMIRGMVDGLATRLKENPNDQQGWMRLMRARMVLGDRAAAGTAYQDAMRTFAASPADQRALTQAAKELGIPGA